VVEKVERGEVKGAPIARDAVATALRDVAPSERWKAVAISGGLVVGVGLVATLFAWHADHAARVGASAEPAPKTSAASAGPVAAPVGTTGPRPSGAVTRPLCDPPYTLDPSGIHIPKAECL
jgi:hypothetical protein